MTQTLPAWLPAVIAGGLVAAVDWVWPQDGQDGAHAGAGGPETPSQDSRDTRPAPKPADGRTAPRNDRSTR